MTARKRPIKKATKPTAKTSPVRVTLREGGGTLLTVRLSDHELYGKAAAWNRLLSSDRGRQTDAEKEAQSWREKARQAIREIAGSDSHADDFLRAAAASGIVQIEMKWQGEETGYAARVFPWEALLALATKEERLRTSRHDFTVLRVLEDGERPTAATGAPAFVVSPAAVAAGFDTHTEQAAIQNALGGTLVPLPAGSSEELARSTKEQQPKIIHLVLGSLRDDVFFSGGTDGEPSLEDLAKILASHGPEIVAFSSCYTGRRLAPLAVAHGAAVALGFHGEVFESCIPVFFGAFYRAWQQGVGVLEALSAGLEANRSQARPQDLGVITLWSAKPLIGVADHRPEPAAGRAIPDIPEIRPDEIAASLPVICTIEEALNYSVLHNSRGGLFKEFAVTKIRPGRLEPLEVSVCLNTGLDRPAECHCFVDLPFEADRQVDLAARVTLPLGSQLLRQRGEILLATVEIDIKCGASRIFHGLHAIRLLPCDEWRDDETGRHLLPSFVFPRDPAVRDILSAAQPFLCALSDQPQTGFSGYPATSGQSESVEHQAKAIWAALQHAWRLDYVSPPPAYTKASQRLRTPEEILRARRGTCIELSLLLASCWEHVGIFPVVFLTTGHAFAGYWTSETAHDKFIEGLDNLLEAARKNEILPPVHSQDEPPRKKVREPWMLAELHHLEAIREEIKEGRLVAIEATFIPLRQSFADSVKSAAELLNGQRGLREFDGMLDVQTARDKGVTPLALISQGIVA